MGAARAVFAEDGYASAQNSRIAARAGVAPSTMYHYFGSKLDLYVTVFRDAEAKVTARYRLAIEDRETALARVSMLAALPFASPYPRSGDARSRSEETFAPALGE